MVFVAVIVFGIEIGLLIGLTNSLLVCVWRMKPNLFLSSLFSSANEIILTEQDSIGVFAFPKFVFFFSVEYHTNAIQHSIRTSGLQKVIFQMSAVHYLDTSAAESIAQLSAVLLEQGVAVSFCQASVGCEEILRYYVSDCAPCFYQHLSDALRSSST